MDFYAGAYISETSHKSYRNILGSIKALMVACGITFVLCVEYVSDWRMTSYAIAVINMLASVAPLFLPETPYYLMDHLEEDKAK